MDFRRVAETVAEFFTARELPFAVVGGVALHAYGLSRTTYDLDLLTSSEAQAEVVAFLESLGYETLYRSAGFSNHNHPRQEWGRVDVVYVEGDTLQQMFAGVERKPAMGLDLPVPRAEHLAAMKLHALRNDPDRAAQDFADLRYLIHLPEVDQEEVKGYFARQGMLDRYDDLREET
ncbi:MAG TPA: hypothetical protein VKU40_02150 [Thermoanaerobaculia bacterium]|nr:hypothetical protein [Thermoanaerobaculia bacterium]